MDNSEIARLLYSRNRAPRWTEYGQEVVESIAAKQGRTFESLGEAIFRLAFFLEERGNKGLYPQYFENTLPKEVVENPEHVPAWDNILFQEREGRWYVRKKPHWSLVWGERYGWQTEPGQLLIARYHDEALAMHAEVMAYLESQKPQTRGGNHCREMR